MFKKTSMSVLSGLKTQGKANNFQTWQYTTVNFFIYFKVYSIDQLILALISRFGVILV